MQVVRFSRKIENNKIYLDIAKEWWLLKTKENMPELFITDFGFMAFKDQKPICSVFLYPISGCDSCIWALHSSSPESTKEERKDAISELCKEVEITAKEMGFKAIVGYPKMKSITDRMIENGFIITETGANQCVKYIGG